MCISGQRAWLQFASCYFITLFWSLQWELEELPYTWRKMMESSYAHMSLMPFDSLFCANDECAFWVNIYDFILHSLHFVGWFWSKKWELEGLPYTHRKMMEFSCRHMFLRIFDLLYCVNDGCAFYDDRYYFNFYSLCFLIRCKSPQRELEKLPYTYRKMVKSSCMFMFLMIFDH